MVYLDYELAPSNRVFENRSNKDLYKLRLRQLAGNNFLTEGYKYLIFLGTFGYFSRKFYVPKNYLATSSGLVCSFIMSAYLARAFEKISFLYVGNINEYSYLIKNEEKMKILFDYVQDQENNKSMTIYS